MQPVFTQNQLQKLFVTSETFPSARLNRVGLVYLIRQG